MSTGWRTALGASVIASLALTASTQAAAPRVNKRSLLASRRLWATIDVCNPKDQPDTVGVRGSMPGDGQARDHMYMSFRLQMQEPRGRWSYVSGSTPSFIAVGTGASARQGGSSFVIKPVAGKPPIVLRGIVVFQWRRGATVLEQTARTTQAGHESYAGADPAGFSAATCSLG